MIGIGCLLLGFPALGHRNGDSARAQLREFIGFESQQLAQDDLSVLPERRRRASDFRFSAGVEADRRDRYAGLAAARMVGVDPEAACLEMRIVGHLARRLHWR